MSGRRELKGVGYECNTGQNVNMKACLTQNRIRAEIKGMYAVNEHRLVLPYASFRTAHFPLLKVAALYCDKLTILGPMGASWAAQGGLPCSPPGAAAKGRGHSRWHDAGGCAGQARVAY